MTSSMENNTHSIEILLVKDNPGDARLTIEAMHEARIRNRMRVVEDGVAVVSLPRK